jgi:hypothetical protein
MKTMNWNTRSKLLTGLVIMIILAVIIGGLGFFTIIQISQQQNIFPDVMLLGLFGVAILILANWLGQTFDKIEAKGTKQTSRLERVIDINQRLSAILDLRSLMREVVTTTKETFDYYYIHIYLLWRSWYSLETPGSHYPLCRLAKPGCPRRSRRAHHQCR